MWSLLLQLVLFSVWQAAVLQGADLPDEIAVCEAVVLHHLQWSSAEHRNTVIYYFEVRAKSGHVGFPEVFFAKYKDYTPPFKKATELNGSQSAFLWTPRWSWSFRRPQRIDKDTYEVSGGYYCGSLCAKYCDYRVARKNGKWAVQSIGSCISS